VEGGVGELKKDEGESQAESSIQYKGNETRAVASSQGRMGGGVAQAQVSGTYSGTGSFSAQAQTGDETKGAQSQIEGNGGIAKSTSQGRAGRGKSQAEVGVGAEAGSTLAQSQSSGADYSTNSQVEAGAKGGLADAQSKGPGSTQSQAQIGFAPYEPSPEDEGKSPFTGGGSASAQSSGASGQSQSQIRGSFKYGITYSGAAQAGSGSSRLVFPKLDLPAVDSSTTQPPDPSKPPSREETKGEMRAKERPPQEETRAKERPPQEETRIKERPPQEETRAKERPPQEEELEDYEEDEDDYDEDEDEDDDLRGGRGGGGGLQTRKGGLVVGPGQRIAGYTVPQGFRGRLTNRPSPHLRSASPPYDSFVTLSNSVTGKIDDKQEKKFQQTYYTKSSTCGYFTFTCSIVSGSNGRTKICKPKSETNPDGTPCTLAG
jgi:hypothetical protein